MRMRRLASRCAFAAAVLLACSEAPAPAPNEPAPPEPAASAPSPAPAPTPSPEPEAPEGGDGATADAARGATLYAIYCASCHGVGGEGDGPVAAALDPQPAKHSDAAYMATLSDEHIFSVIKQGGPAVGKSPLMAPFGGTLSDAQIRDLVAFVRSLSQ